ncbi:toll-like receptor 3 [Octopus vulgaris]|uniref:Toll-like receptor 3 n=2 Tax=Octopus TaxID=6643 RepID=A0A2I7NB23_OCTVU|nr:tool like receptor 3 [Octopus vulgaris]CAI9723303.1 toll-like receptor 3 [Octopus vulgaris]
MKLLLIVFICIMSICIVNTTCPESCQCNKEQTKVSCKRQSLTSVPKSLPTTTEVLSLEYNLLREITAESFKNLVKLKELVLTSNKISVIRKNSFKYQSKLVSLYLINNIIHTIENGSFVGAISLASIYLNSNQLKDVPCLYGLISLKHLLINTNQISEVFFPAEYRQIKNLTYINLSNNKINRLTVNSLMNLNESNIKKISFSRNQITNIEPETFRVLSNINSLNLAENPFTADVLKNSLYAMRNFNLRSLDLSGLKKINVLADNIFEALQNTSLQTLILSHSNISRVSSNTFKLLDSLEVLKLDFCQIASLEESTFTNLTHLRRLFLNGNYISKLTAVFPSKLLYLYLNSNKIQKVPSKVFDELFHLIELHLQYNKIVQFDKDAFIGLENLKTLKLQHNHINVIPGGLFSTLAGLSDLQLGSNDITTIPEEIFIRLKSLSFLDLSNNHISKMPKSFSKELTRIRKLYLDSNKLGKFLSTDKKGFLLSGLKNLERIDLSYNEIQGHLSKKIFQNNKHLKYIYFRGNKITGWENNTFEVTNLTLMELDVSNNFIITFDSDSLKYINRKKKFNITLNPFACDCNLRWFRDWLNTTTVDIVDKNDLMCNSPPDWQGKKLLDFSRSKIDCTDYTLYYILAGGGGGFLLTVVIVIFAYTKRWYIKFKMFKLYQYVQKSGNEKEYEAIPGDDMYFDGYISYSDKDSEWVEKYLMHTFDNGENGENKNNGNFKLCFRNRDFAYGKYIIGMIESSLAVSKKMIVVLTPYYKKDKRCEFELQLGIMKLNIRNVMPIVLKNLQPNQIPNSLKEIFETNKFIEWDNNEYATNFIKRKLENFLN